MRNILSIGVLAGAVICVVLTLMKGLQPNFPPRESRIHRPIDFSKEYPASDASVRGFEKKKTGALCTVYYHPSDGTNANKTLAVLEQAGLPLYQTYLGITPKHISVYLAATVDEYVTISQFPGGKTNVRVGDGSAPDGNIYLYKPFDNVPPGETSGNVIIHEGVHAVIFQYLESMKYLPSFLNEGLAHFVEYVYKAGPKFDPMREMYHSDLLVNAVKKGGPGILPLNAMQQRCEGYIPEENLNFLCRGEGTFLVWYINKTYGEGIWGKFLQALKQTQSWQNSLQQITGKTPAQLDQDITAQLQLTVHGR